MFTHKIKWMSASLALITLLASCGTPSDQSGEETSGTTPPSVQIITTTEPVTETTAEPTKSTTLDIVKNGKTTFKVIRGDNASEEIGVASVHLRKAINDATGANVGILSDWVKDESALDPNATEILVGATNRQASKDFQATLTGYSFGIKITENQVVIAATHEDFIPLAVDYFMEHYLTSGEHVEIGEGTYSISSAASVICNGTPADMTNIRLESNYATISEKVAQVPKDGNFKIMQGGCVTEDYAYMAMINTADYDTKAAGCYIYKYDVKTWKLVKRSKVLMLDHANDITYNPDNNMLYVSHCYVDSKKISLIDADTLELKTSIWSDSTGLYAFDYNEENNLFVGGTGKSTTMIYKNQLNGTQMITSGRIQGITTQMTTQGICSDANYVYHVMFTTSASPDEPYNAIFIYDLDAKKLAHNVRLSISGQEPENISIVNGEFYIGCNASGSACDIYKSVLYEFDFDAVTPCP